LPAKVVVAGGGDLGRVIAERLIREGFDVTLIEKDSSRARELAESLDCSVVNGDATLPEVLKSVGVSEASFVAATGSDKDNILSSLIARQLGAAKVVTVVENLALEPVASGLGLENVVVPTNLAAKEVLAVVRGLRQASSGLLKGDARFVTAVVGEELGGKRLSEIKLPGGSVVCAVFRGDEFILPTENPQLSPGDELLIIARESKVSEVLKRLGVKEK